MAAAAMSVVYVLTTPMPEVGGDDPTVEQVKKRNKKELWDSLEAKYMAKDASRNKKYFVTFIDDASRIFVGYAEHSKDFRFYVIEPNDSDLINSIIKSRDAIFDENRFSSVPRPSLRIPDGTEDIGDSVDPEEVTKEVVQQPGPELLDKRKGIGLQMDFRPEFQLYLVEGTRDEVSDQHSYCFNVEDDPKTFDEAMKSKDVTFRKEAINDEVGLYHSKDLMESGKGFFFCLYVDEHLFFDNKTKFRIKHESNGIAISQSHYIRRPDIAFVVGKPSRYTSNPDASWIDNTEDNSSASGWVLLLGGGAISWASKKQTCITGSTMESEFMALVAAGKEVECAATLAKAYIQMYNGKSIHLGVSYSMIHELITNTVISIEFVRSQQNLADHLTKGLARDLVIKSAEGMGLKSN
ncbi:hypothetical protein Tco_0612170 [Tanacetum coccineum]